MEMQATTIHMARGGGVFGTVWGPPCDGLVHTIGTQNPTPNARTHASTRMGWSTGTCLEKLIFVLGVIEVVPITVALFYSALLGFAAFVWLGTSGIAIGTPGVLVVASIFVAIVLELAGSGICSCKCSASHRANLLFAAVGVRVVAIGCVGFLIWIFSSGVLDTIYPPSAPPPPMWPVGAEPPPSPPWFINQPPASPQTWPSWPPNPPAWPAYPAFPPDPPGLPPGTYVITESQVFIWALVSLILMRIIFSIILNLCAALHLRKSGSLGSAEKV